MVHEALGFPWDGGRGWYARERGRIARAAALERYGLGRFLADWDRALASVVRVTELEAA